MVTYKSARNYGRRTGKKVFKVAKKRYYNKKRKTVNYGKMAKDVQVLKSIINSEKKQLTIAPITTNIGQVNGNSEGAYTVDITPAPVQGLQDSQRIGDSLKITTAVFDFQFIHMSSTTAPVTALIEIYAVQGMPQATSTFLNQLYLPTTFITGTSIRDMHAKYDQDYRSQYKLIARRKIRVKGDSYSGQTQLRSLKIPLRFGKYGHHIKYQENTSTIASGQIMMCVRCDAGNFNGSVTSTVNNVAIPTVGSGLKMNMAMEYYYYDN